MTRGLTAAEAEAIEKLCGEGAEFAGREREVKEAVRSLTKKSVRKRIVDEGLRIDGRGPRDLRPLSSEVTVLAAAPGLTAAAAAPQEPSLLSKKSNR